MGVGVGDDDRDHDHDGHDVRVIQGDGSDGGNEYGALVLLKVRIAGIGFGYQFSLGAEGLKMATLAYPAASNV